MKAHTKIYTNFFQNTYLPCEVCLAPGVDVHHIERRGMGGKNQEADRIENLMLLCRQCHQHYGDKKHHLLFLQERHNWYIVHHKKLWNYLDLQSVG